MCLALIMVLAVLLSLQAEVKASYARRFSHLSRVQNEDFRSWFGARLRDGVAPDEARRKDVEDMPDPDVLASKLHVVLKKSQEQPTSITLFEEGFVNHVSTRSKHGGTKSWLPRLRRYVGRHNRPLSSSQLAKSRKIVRAILSGVVDEVPLIEQLPYEEVYLEGRNSGLPDLVPDQRDIRDDAAAEAARIVAAVESIPEGRTPRWDMAPPPALGLRTQEGGGEFAKTRPIWMYPLAVKLIEASFQQPLEEALIATYPHISWQRSEVIGETISKLFKRRRGYILGMDYSRYDSTVHGSLIRVIFEEIGSIFGRERLFAWIARYFTESPILIPIGGGELHLKSRSRGVPSGSPFTSLVDSVANLVYSGLIGNDYKDAIVLGDDKVEWSELRAVPLAVRYANLGLSVSRVWEFNCAKNLVTVYARDGDFGSRSYTDVGSISNEATVEYLSHLWTHDGTVTGSVFRALNNTLRQERYKGGDRKSVV